MTRPKFANNAQITGARRPRRPDVEATTPSVSTETAMVEVQASVPTRTPVSYNASITDYMTQQMLAKEHEPTRPITLRFEESLWQQVEHLRGNLSKNDFFKYLVQYYVTHSQNLNG